MAKSTPYKIKYNKDNREKNRLASKEYYKINKDEINRKEGERRKIPSVRKEITRKSKLSNRKYRDNLTDTFFLKKIYNYNIRSPSANVNNRKTREEFLNAYKACYIFKQLLFNKINKKKALKIMANIEKNLSKESEHLKKLIKMMLNAMKGFIDGEISISQGKVISSMGNTTYKAIAGKVTIDQALINQ